MLQEEINAPRGMPRNPRLFKQGLAKFLKSSKNLAQDNFYPLYLNYHGQPVALYAETYQLFKIFASETPKAWQLSESEFESRPEPLEFYWYDASKLVARPEIFEWDIEADYYFDELDGQFAFYQRDCIGIEMAERRFMVATLPEVTDGFKNVFRLLLPYYLSQRGVLVLHSSCILGRDGYVHVMLGVSGAGKTTTASLAEDRLVLGDDINLFHIKEDGVYAQSAFLGGNPQLKAPYEKLYPVKAFYWIHKDRHHWLRPMQTSQFGMRLMMSVIHWSPKESYRRSGERIFQNIEKMQDLAKGYDLGFKKDSQFFDLIEDSK